MVPSLETNKSYFAKKARIACAGLWSFAKIFPIGEPRAWFCEGWKHRLEGRLNAAQKDWEKGVILANRLRMPYEEGRLHYEIGRFLKTDDPERIRHLREACEIFSKIGANYDLALAQSSL
jgi:hypothetical protein